VKFSEQVISDIWFLDRAEGCSFRKLLSRRCRKHRRKHHRRKHRRKQLKHRKLIMSQEGAAIVWRTLLNSENNSDIFQFVNGSCVRAQLLIAVLRVALNEPNLNDADVCLLQEEFVPGTPLPENSDLVECLQYFYFNMSFQNKFIHQLSSEGSSASQRSTDLSTDDSQAGSDSHTSSEATSSQSSSSECSQQTADGSSSSASGIASGSMIEDEATSSQSSGVDGSECSQQPADGASSSTPGITSDSMMEEEEINGLCGKRKRDH